MTSALRGGGGVSPKEDVVREVAWICGQGGGGGKKIRNFCGTPKWKPPYFFEDCLFNLASVTFRLLHYLLVISLSFSRDIHFIPHQTRLPQKWRNFWNFLRLYFRASFYILHCCCGIHATFKRIIWDLENTQRVSHPWVRGAYHFRLLPEPLSPVSGLRDCFPRRLLDPLPTTNVGHIDGCTNKCRREDYISSGNSGNSHLLMNKFRFDSRTQIPWYFESSAVSTQVSLTLIRVFGKYE